FGHVAMMIRHGCVSFCFGVIPDLMTAGGLSIKLKSTNSELSNNFPITKAGESTHLCRYDDRVVATIGRCRKRDFAFPLTARFNELPGNISRDVEGLGNRPPLRYQARQFVRG